MRRRLRSSKGVVRGMNDARLSCVRTAGKGAASVAAAGCTWIDCGDGLGSGFDAKAAAMGASAGCSSSARSGAGVVCTERWRGASRADAGALGVVAGAGDAGSATAPGDDLLPPIWTGELNVPAAEVMRRAGIADSP
jgi:hypothetical protein